MVNKAELECFRYSDLEKGADLKHTVERAFGDDGLGIVVVTGVLGISDSRRELFTLGHRFANFPQETRASCEHPGSHFNFGWSHGKEMLEMGTPDFTKGSYYANPCHDAPFAHDPEAVKAYPSFAHPNIWPDDHHDGRMTEFATEFKALGQAVVRVGVLVARQCDRYVESVHSLGGGGGRNGSGYEAGKLERVVSTARCHKGRLLHYFPRVQDKQQAGTAMAATEEAADEPTIGAGDAGVAGQSAADGGGVIVGTDVAADRNGRDGDAEGKDVGGGGGGGGGGGDEIADDGRAFSDWCGWHHDHSSLTGLVVGMFLDADGREVENRDPDCGLFIRSRQGSIVKAALPKGESPSTCLLFQIGETTQVHSGGVLQATPHAVRSTRQPGVSREAFAVFMQPEWTESMDVPVGTDPSSTRSLHAKSLLPRGVVPVAERLRPGMDFGAFTDATLTAYWPTTTSTSP